MVLREEVTSLGVVVRLRVKIAINLLIETIKIAEYELLRLFLNRTEIAAETLAWYTIDC